MRPTDIPDERWVPITGFAGYHISDYGRVYSDKSNALRKPGLNKSGYLQLQLQAKSVLKMMTIHRLVALHFVVNTHEDPQVNHMDGVKTNNYFGNLEWCSAKENVHHAMGIGLRPGIPIVEEFSEEDAWLMK